MILNTAGQKVGAQMVAASDGSAFTGSVTVSVTVDAGTQATGSVGSGACVHEGNGYHTYAPAQAETNGALIAFTFTGTGAVPQTVQVYTRLTNPTVDVETIKTQTVTCGAGVTVLASVGTAATSTAQTGDSYAIVNSGTHGNAAIFGLLDTEVAAILAAVDTEVAAIKAKTDSLTYTVANVLDANIQRINDVTVNGDGAGTPWGP
jgi:O-acetylhomoserine/O-acetylserine sulfhydrylase-like pyridoxal-dependent enzyme